VIMAGGDDPPERIGCFDADVYMTKSYHISSPDPGRQDLHRFDR